MAKEHWMSEPEDHDYPAALDYLTLVMPEKEAAKIVEELRVTPLVHRKAKDLLRASQLPLLPPENAHVAEDLHKVKKGKLLSPVLVVRGLASRDLPLCIADGYHRICASYFIDENADIPCHIANFA
jgi:hypothetical protein